MQFPQVFQTHPRVFLAAGAFLVIFGLALLPRLWVQNRTGGLLTRDIPAAGGPLRNLNSGYAITPLVGASGATGGSYIGEPARPTAPWLFGEGVPPADARAVEVSTARAARLEAEVKNLNAEVEKLRGQVQSLKQTK